MKRTQMDQIAALQKGNAKLLRGQAVLPTSREGETQTVRVDAKTVKYVRAAQEGVEGHD